jgi:hypothetical protein
MSAPRPIPDEEMAVGVLSDGLIGLMLPGGGVFEMSPLLAETTGKAMIAAAQYAREVRAGRAQQN